jgi:hypothetical protein
VRRRAKRTTLHLRQRPLAGPASHRRGSKLRELAADYQKALTGVPGIDLIPPQWLHLTMQGIGFTDEIDADELAALDHALTAELAAIEPPAAEFRYLTIHPADPGRVKVLCAWPGWILRTDP